jgi:hypothetical protein
MTILLSTTVHKKSVQYLRGTSTAAQRGRNENMALISSDVFGCGIQSLIHCRVIEPHGVEACALWMQKIRDFGRTASRLEGPKLMNSREANVMPKGERHAFGTGKSSDK